MIAGDPNRKSVRPEVQDDISQIYYCEQQDASGKKIGSSESHSMPTKHCDVLVAKSFYPTCWSGAAFDPKNPRSVYVSLSDLEPGLTLPLQSSRPVRQLGWGTAWEELSCRFRNAHPLHPLRE